MTLESLHCIAPNGRMVVNYTLEINGRNWSWPNLLYQPYVFLEGLKDSTKHLRSRYSEPSKDSNRVPTKYKFEALPLTSVW
jgi:hypothetical protein